MNRIETIAEGVTLYLGDCREILPTLDVVDAVVTDPPYCSGGFSETGKKQAAGMGLRSETIRELGWFTNDNMTTAGISWLMSTVAGWCYRLMPPGGTMTTFTDWRMVGHLAPAIESSQFRYQNLIVWAKPSAGLGAGFRAQHELAMHFAKGTAKYYSAKHGNVLGASRIHSSEREHQTEKPVELIGNIIEVVSDRGMTILDPFMGSGTTGVAAVKMARKFIGIEIEPKYFDIACRRITDAANDLFAAPPAAPVQEGFDYDAKDDFAKSIEVCYEAVRERVAAGGPAWDPDKPPAPLNIQHREGET